MYHSSKPAAWVPAAPKLVPKDRQPVLNVLFALCKICANLKFSRKKDVFPLYSRYVIENNKRSSAWEPARTQKNPRNPNNIPREPKPLSPISPEWWAGISAVDGVTFTVRAGKSTTMKPITRLMDLTHGEIRFNGEPIHRGLLAYKRHICYVPEDPHPDWLMNRHRPPLS